MPGKKRWGCLFLVLLALGMASAAWADWQAVGGNVNTDTSTGVNNPSLAISSTGSLSVAYEQVQSGNTTNVYVNAFNGTDWGTPLGGNVNPESFVQATGPSLILDKADKPVLGFVEVDGSLNYSRYVRTWNFSWTSSLGFQNSPDKYYSEYLAKPNTVNAYAYIRSERAQADIHDKIYYQAFDGDGNIWRASENLVVLGGTDASLPKLCFSQATPFSIWCEKTGTGPYYYYLWSQYRQPNGTWFTAGGAHLNNGSGHTSNPVLGTAITASQNGTVYAAWVEQAGGTKIYASKYSGAAWSSLGSGCVNPPLGGTTYSAVAPSLAVLEDGSTDGIPCIAWYETSEGNIHVYMWDGAAWNALGSDLRDSGMTIAQAPCLAARDATLCLAYEEERIGEYRLVVKQWTTPTPTATITPTLTPTLSITPSSTITFSPTCTQTSLGTATISCTPTITSTAAIVFSATPTPTPTASPTVLPPTQTPTSRAAALTIGNQAVAFPVPASTWVRFAFSTADGGNGEVSILVYNSHFLLVKQLQGSAIDGKGEIEWQISDIAPGVYFYAVKVGSKKLPTQKLVIAR